MATVGEGWFVDPTGRFEGRFFDGLVWTDQVSDDGVLKSDPDWILTRRQAREPELPVIDTADDVAAGQGSYGSDRRRGGERRQIDMEVAVDRRRGERRQ